MDSRTFALLATVLIALVIFSEREPLPTEALAATTPQVESVLSSNAVDQGQVSLPRFQPEFELRGPVLAYTVNADGQPLPWVEVTLESGLTIQQQTSDALGRFTLPEGSDTSANMRFRRQGFVTVSAPLHQVRKHREVTLLPGSAVLGEVVDPSGLPIEGAEIRVRTTSGWRDTVSTNDNGHFELWAPSGSLLMNVHSTLHADQGPMELAVRPNAPQRVRVELPLGITLRVRVTDSESTPISDARVALHSTGGDEELAITNANGEATVSGIGGDRAQLAITHSGYAAVVETLQLRATQGREGREFVLAPAQPWNWQVLGSDFGPVAGAELVVVQSGIELVRARATDETIVQILAPDRLYDVFISAPRYQPLRTQIRNDGGQLASFQLVGASRLEGRLVTILNRGRPSATVRVGRWIQDDHYVPTATTLTDATGSFDIDELPAGRYRVEVSCDSQIVETFIELSTHESKQLPTLILK